MDRQLQCVDCGDSFVWTSGEQEFFQKNNFSEPKRCKPCRQKKRENREEREQRDRY